MRTVMKINDPSLWIECKYNEADKTYRVYKLCRFTGQCGYPTTQRRMILKCQNIHSVMEFLANLC